MLINLSNILFIILLLFSQILPIVLKIMPDLLLIAFQKIVIIKTNIFIRTTNYGTVNIVHSPCNIHVALP